MQLTGAMTALVTPMAGGRLDIASLSRLVDFQIDGGIHALVAVGTTGESATLSEEEHIEVVRQVVKAARGRVPVIAGGGGNATAASIARSKRCVEVGADALLHVVPYYNKPTQDGLVAHFEAVASATERPVILYNVPGRTVADMLPETVARLADHPRVAAIKEATGNMARASKVIELCGARIKVLSGDDFTVFPLYALGGHGVISVISNILPGPMAQMWNAAAAGKWDEARDIHYRIQPLCELLFAEPNPTPVKAALDLMGIIGGEIRLPLLPASAGLRDRLKDELVRSGLL